MIDIPNRLVRALRGLLLIGILSACGGGGGDDPPPRAAARPSPSAAR